MGIFFTRVDEISESVMIKSNASGENLLQQLQKDLQGVCGLLQADVGLHKVTWFRTGGAAQILFEPTNLSDLQLFLKKLPRDIPVMVVGIGSNLLIRDGGIPGVVIRLPVKAFSQMEMVSDTQILASAAVPDKWLANFALKNSLAGFHFFYGIPGSLGGALRMNAGANGVETSERVVRVQALDRRGELHELRCSEMNYQYRHAQVDPELIFISALLEGEKGEVEKIQADIDAVVEHRESVQPVREKTGGSTFKNPESQSAWQLIDSAGCRGLVVGGAQMSPMHCNFMINQGNASSYDLEKLGETVRARVLRQHGIVLEWEIDRIGNFAEGQIVYPLLLEN